ncbi:MAG: hypothetical protein IJ440_04270 [Alphaproteobacteria bacterium]|nr:hypothetical protein [Alphaproteobacteria bacterium]
MRLLPEGRRKALMHFVSNERNHGAYCLYSELFQDLISGFVVQLWDTCMKKCCILILFLMMQQIACL